MLTNATKAPMANGHHNRYRDGGPSSPFRCSNEASRERQDSGRNGACEYNLENLKQPDDTWKLWLIEVDFHRWIFDMEGL